jgi:hypothetical protein
MNRMRAIFWPSRAAFGGADVSERRACAALGQHRSTQRKVRAVGTMSAKAGLPGSPVAVLLTGVLAVWSIRREQAE